MEVGEKVIENIFHRMASSKRGHEPVLSRQNVIELNNELQRRSTRCPVVNCRTSVATFTVSIIRRSAIALGKS